MNTKCREAVQQHVHELQGLSGEERVAEERAIYKRELRHHRARTHYSGMPLAFAISGSSGGDGRTLFDIFQSCRNSNAKMRRKLRIANVAEFKVYLESNGITIQGLRRHLIRDTMLNILMRELVKPALNSVTLDTLKAYYDEHPGEFYTELCLEWSEHLVSIGQYKTSAEAKQRADELVARFNKKSGSNSEKKADDVLWKVETGAKVNTMNGPITSRMAGDKLSPVLAPLVQSLREGEVGMVEGLHGFHVIRMIRRIDTNIKPFTDESVQQQIRKRLEGKIGDLAYRALTKQLVVRALVEQALLGDKKDSSIEAVASADADSMAKNQVSARMVKDWLQKGEDYLKVDDKAQAQKCFEKGIQFGEEFPGEASLRCRIRLAELLIQSKDNRNIARAMDDLEKKVLSHSEIGNNKQLHEQVLTLIADALFYQGEYTKAETRYRTVLDNDPEGSKAICARFQLGLCYFRLAGMESDRCKEADKVRSDPASSSKQKQEANTVYKQSHLRYMEALKKARDPFIACETSLQQTAPKLTRENAILLRRASFYAADCAYFLGEYEDAMGRYEGLTQRYTGTVAELEAFKQMYEGRKFLGETDKANDVLLHMFTAYTKMPESAFDGVSLVRTREYWSKWFKANQS